MDCGNLAGESRRRWDLPQSFWTTVPLRIRPLSADVWSGVICFDAEPWSCCNGSSGGVNVDFPKTRWSTWSNRFGLKEKRWARRVARRRRNLLALCMVGSTEYEDRAPGRAGSGAAVESPYYFRIVADYIHLNPARAGIVGKGRGKLVFYKWRSIGDHARGKGTDWLVLERVLSGFEPAKDGTRAESLDCMAGGKGCGSRGRKYTPDQGATDSDSLISRYFHCLKLVTACMRPRTGGSRL